MALLAPAAAAVVEKVLPVMVILQASAFMEVVVAGVRSSVPLVPLPPMAALVVRDLLSLPIR
jgi:hypothetical protein